MTPSAPPSAPATWADAQALERTVGRLGHELATAYPAGMLLVGVLHGCLPFVADLARSINAPCEVDFLAVSPYQAGSGKVRILMDLDRDIEGRDVVLVHEMVDTGLTCSYVWKELERRSPHSLELCTLLDRAARRIVPIPLRFVGMQAPREQVVGYGLSHRGYYANLRHVATVDTAVLEKDPDAYVSVLYGR